MSNHYRTSDGKRVAKTYIDFKIREAKEIKLRMQMEEYGYNFCEECRQIISSGNAVIMKNLNEMELKILDCSHIVSVKKCQEEGRTELSWDVSNIRILCRCHHEIYDTNLIMSGHEKSS